ncbi:MAG: glutamate--tRNA ligase [Candidatus Kerfeldbacteria bacterium]|nr:glutamate--tRNA ligase [Candidatus Kerfeldbacteria bacterium]
MNTRNVVRTRFAPSPTGKLHIGGARTALFAYLWAKKNNGQFLLRIEDTDKTREVENGVAQITEGLRWLGLTWDEGPEVGGEHGPYIQSQRLDIYQRYAKELIAKKAAYYCFCTSERLDAMRKEQQAQKQPPRYDRYCRRMTDEAVQAALAKGVNFVVRLTVPESGKITIHDIVRGDIVFDWHDIDDQVLMKSDGYPTYHLANVIDDHLMQITHVIRGEEWLPSTPKHILLYQLFGWAAPEFTHLSIFLSKQGGKMSKRHGDTSLLHFRDQGYLPEAVVNFAALLGWNPKTTEEFFTLEELTERFELTQIHKANPVFETEKLDWINQHYMKKLSVLQLLENIRNLSENAEEISPLYKKFVQWFSSLSTPRQESIWGSLKERTHTLREVAESIVVVEGAQEYDPKKLVWKKSTVEETCKVYIALQEKIAHISEEQFLAKPLNDIFMQWIPTTGWGNGDVLWPMRYALSGVDKSPSPFELAEILGKEETLKRLQYAQTILTPHQ